MTAVLPQVSYAAFKTTMGLTEPAFVKRYNTAIISRSYRDKYPCSIIKANYDTLVKII